MSKTLCLIFGNGLTIDLINHLKLRDTVDVTNLFHYGAEVPWPATGEPGFLSFKHCPNLWNLGARPHMETVECLSLIEDIITCANAFASKDPSKRNLAKSATKAPNEIYLNAFKELSLYLKHLFVHYDSIVAPKLSGASTWPWLDFLKRVGGSGQYDRVEIITFNYDPWLERILTQEGIPFCITPMQSVPTSPPVRVFITKPHGSISFCHDQKLDKKSFAINYDKTLVDGELTDFKVSYSDLDDNYLVTPLIPPAGEARRLNQTWASEIQKHCITIAESLTDADDMLICGLSYWHVDRAELDALLNSCSSAINIKMINPHPSRTLTAVITSIFDRFICYSSNAILNKILR
jgi:hypothetical protein